MSDWKFGDILEHGTEGHTRVMFVGRKKPIQRAPDGHVLFWGFVGLNLPLDCPGCSQYGHNPVGSVWAAFGGDPDDPHRGDVWRVVGVA